MIDYYTLICQTLPILETNTEPERHLLYERVRNSLARILRDTRSAPNEDETIQECLGLEDVKSDPALRNR